ncbi:MAG: purine-nucleoside phosphorylase [Candidatus Kerfeldbacteria bacterium]|nr:purine-nucleoside phosphorylase [Candidatus Kerfeldbacteria bacterium]
MATHINTQNGQIAETVFLPGDPKRAELIAQQFLTNIVRYNDVRNMWGFTGTDHASGKLVSVQGGGMGQPSNGIYISELAKFLGVKKIIRLGTTGSYQENVKLHDLVIAMGGCTDSGMNRLRFNGMNFAPIASWNLLYQAFRVAQEMKLNVHVGNVLGTDFFYDAPYDWKIWARYEVLSVDMEVAELYTLAAFHHIEALSICTVSDNLVTGQRLSPEERELCYPNMVRIALRLV